MAKIVADVVLDAALAKIAQADGMVACSQQPTSFAEAATTYKLANTSMVTSDDYTIGDGDTNGRKVAVSQQTSVWITATGNGNHVALVDSDNAELLYVTTATSQTLTTSNTMTFNGWDVELADPT